MKTVKKYKKSELRKKLEKSMRERRHDPELTVSPMEFSRMLKVYCEYFDHPDSIRRAKELDEPLVAAFSTWLGYPLR